MPFSQGPHWGNLYNNVRYGLLKFLCQQNSLCVYDVWGCYKNIPYGKMKVCLRSRICCLFILHTVLSSLAFILAVPPAILLAFLSTTHTSVRTSPQCPCRARRRRQCGCHLDPAHWRNQWLHHRIRSNRCPAPRDPLGSECGQPCSNCLHVGGHYSREGVHYRDVGLSGATFVPQSTNHHTPGR